MKSQTIVNHMSKDQLLEDALRRSYGHNIDDEVTGWFTPVSEDVIDFGDDSPYDVIDEVFECVEKHIHKSPIFVFYTKYGWFVIKMEYSESDIPNEPCLSIYKGVVRTRNELWSRYIRRLQARTSNYIM